MDGGGGGVVRRAGDHRGGESAAFPTVFDYLRELRREEVPRLLFVFNDVFVERVWIEMIMEIHYSESSINQVITNNQSNNNETSTDTTHHNTHICQQTPQFHANQRNPWRFFSPSSLSS